MSKKQTYTDEFKAEAVKLIDEHDGNVSAAARSLGIAMQTLSNWKTKSEDGRLAGTDGYDEKHMALLEENKKLKRQLKTAQMERDILKKNGVLFQGKSVRYAFMKAHSAIFYLSVMAKLFKVSLSGFYDWLRRKVSNQQIHRNRALIYVKQAHNEMNQTYGHVRLAEYINTQYGFAISQYLVRTLKAKFNIRCKQVKRFKKTTDSNHDKPVYVNLLNQRFDMPTPNVAWVSDITYIWTNEGWCYLAAVKDLCTKQIVGYSINKRMTASLICDALKMAINNKQPKQGLIVHSDRGSQYCSNEYRQLIKKHRFNGSMSAKGNGYDNAAMESFFGLLKNELVHHETYQTRAESKASIVKYIELFYKQVRIQKDLNFKTPNQVWRSFNQLAA